MSTTRMNVGPGESACHEVISYNPDVACRGKIDTCSNCCATDSGDRWHPRLGNGGEHGVDRVEFPDDLCRDWRCSGGSNPRQVASRAEGRPGASDDKRPDRLVEIHQ